MKTRPYGANPLKNRVLRAAVSSLALAALLGIPGTASAQLYRVNGGIATLHPGGVFRGVDTAYDPANDAYLVITAYGPVYGIFTNAAGIPITETFLISNTSFGHFPNAEYSPHVSNGAGGSGGFLVVWNDDFNGNTIRGRVVSLQAPGRVVGGLQSYSNPGVFFENRPVLAYSQSSRRFLVAWTTSLPVFGIQGRLADSNGVPFGAVLGFEGGSSRDPVLAWNPATDEFGLGNTAWGGSGAFAAFRRIRASDGVVSPRSTFGFGGGTYATGLDVNNAGQYVLTWGIHPGTMSVLFDQHGNMLAGPNLVTSRMGGDLSMGLSFNRTLGTFLAVANDWHSYNIAAAELSASGLALAAATTITEESRASYYPLPAARTGSNEWNVVYSPNFLGPQNQLVGSGGGGGTAPPPAPAPAPPPPTGCSTPDPFVSIGGGTCINGGWIPSGGGGSSEPAPAPAPAPPPPSGGCSIPDPFVSIGGGTCINGGWIPGGGGSAPAPAPAPSPSGCSTPDPFVSIGGGTCINGGWVPNTCTIPDPFVSIGGGVCINGGWTPKTGG
jgi:hypothetical protein